MGGSPFDRKAGAEVASGLSVARNASLYWPMNSKATATSPFAAPRLEPAALSRRRFAGTLLAITLAGVVLRFVRLGAQSLWIDEVLSYGWIAEIRNNGFGTLLHDIHGPLHAVAIWATSHVSTSEWWLRFPSAVAGGRRFLHSGYLAPLWGAGSACSHRSPFAVALRALYSQERRNYAFASCSLS